ncbi:PREDICTED: cytochrome P450 6B2-like, partial [Papilio polytes]|uniref:cytochrome P450 6B2-like n=1 Tax=Papilio polytes TaxID=76194 RepID=UPI0006766019
MFYFLILCASVIASLYYYFTRTFIYWKERNIPGPKPLPFFGNIKDSALRSKHLTSVLQDIYNAYPNEKAVGVFRMTTPCLLLRDLDLIKQIMIKDFDQFVDRGLSFTAGLNNASWIGRSLQSRNKTTCWLITNRCLNNTGYCILRPAVSKEGLGFNLFHADTDTWKVLRNRFTPLFTSGKLKNMFYLMTEQGD